MNITRRDFINYALLPGLRPRMKDLFASGFHYVSFFIALVYGAVRLLPKDHPYLNPSNMGKFTLIHVIAEAANNITFSRNNIDQIVLFICVLIGLILIVLQFGLIALAFFIGPAMAQLYRPPNGFFVTTPEQQKTDMAGMLLDMVFGIPDLFNSCISLRQSCKDGEGDPITASVSNSSWMFEPGQFPMPIHNAMHQVLQFYNIGLLVVAFLITMYFIATIILETAESGTPFGKRFNKVWAPVRLVMAFGLLVPVGYGLNSAQYIVLYAAKFGSGFATNGWILFNDELTSQNQLGTEELMVAQPNPPEVGTLLQFLFVAKTCAEYENDTDPPPAPEKKVQPYFVDGPFSRPNAANGPNLLIPAPPGAGQNDDFYERVLEFANGKNQLTIRFGYPDKENKYMMGWITPTCGEMVFRLPDPRTVGDGEDNAERGVEAMQRYYLYIIRELWYFTFEGSSQATYIPLEYRKKYPYSYVNKFSSRATPDPAQYPVPEAPYKSTLQDFYASDLYNAMNDPIGLEAVINTDEGAIAEMSNSGRWEVDQTLKDMGWAGAAIWYNRIAEMNGSLSTAILNIPMPVKFPDVMEQIYYKKRTGEEAITYSTRFEPTISTSSDMSKRTIDPNKAKVFNEAFMFWEQDGGVSTTHSAPAGNAAADILNGLFGTSGLYDMRRNTNVHPLAQLSGLGKALVEGAIRNLTYAAVGGASGAAIGSSSAFVGQTLGMFSTLLVTFAMVGLTAGFVLFYVIPFLPFLYFFFALGRWVKSIFEAMIGAPLWALAHIRIDGEGLAGSAAVPGYFLIFEIFLRPILMVFGLLASISIFAAMVSVLNQIFDLVVANVGGFDVEGESTNMGDKSLLSSMRSSIDEFFYTVVYAILVYMLGMSSFKLIDLIPNNILRYMGQNVTPFNDGDQDPAAALAGKATVGAQQTLGSLGSGLGGFIKAL